MPGQRRTLAQNTILPFPAVAGTKGNNHQRINVKRDNAKTCGKKFAVMHLRPRLQPWQWGHRHFPALFLPSDRLGMRTPSLVLIGHLYKAVGGGGLLGDTHATLPYRTDAKGTEWSYSSRRPTQPHGGGKEGGKGMLQGKAGILFRC